MIGLRSVGMIGLRGVGMNGVEGFGDNRVEECGDYKGFEGCGEDRELRGLGIMGG